MTLMRVFVRALDGKKFLVQADQETETYASFKIKVKEKWDIDMNTSINQLK